MKRSSFILVDDQVLPLSVSVLIVAVDDLVELDHLHLLQVFSSRASSFWDRFNSLIFVHTSVESQSLNVHFMSTFRNFKLFILPIIHDLGREADGQIKISLGA